MKWGGAMEVYIEIVIIDNFIIDFILLYLMYIFLGEKPKTKRIVLGTIIATAFAVVSPMIVLSQNTFLCVKIAMSFLIVYLARLTLKRYIMATLLFYLLTFTFGGVVLGMFNILNIDFADVNSFFILSDFPIGVLVGGIFLATILCMKGYKFAKKRHSKSSFYYDVKIYFRGMEKTIKGYYDSGNFLEDRVTGKGISVVYIRSIFDFLENVDFGTLDRVKFRSVGQVSDSLRILEVDKIELYVDKKLHIIYNGLLGLSYQPISDKGDFDILIGPMLF